MMNKMNMMCPHLKKDGTMDMCNASMPMMMPNSDEMAKYCTTDMHGMCEMFQMRKDMMRKTEMQQNTMM